MTETTSKFAEGSQQRQPGTDAATGETGRSDDDGSDPSVEDAGTSDNSASTSDASDAGQGDSGDTDDPVFPDTCGFDYARMFSDNKRATPTMQASSEAGGAPDVPARIAHAEPAPPFLRTVRLNELKSDEELIMPGYTDTMPWFERGGAWDGEHRCYETPLGTEWLTEEEAWEMYRDIAVLTTGVAMDTSPGTRSVVGLRGAYPGTFEWNGNTPDRFNDTIVLLWTDDRGARRVREFPVHTDVGARDFGVDSSSSLRPNRRYYMMNGDHRSYNALENVEESYRVRNDTNHNGHWDSDRNGWLPPRTADDYDRLGFAHNIHAASVDGPLGAARVGVWSAGCQTIPGMVNWTAFIETAWTRWGDPVDYFLVDARDIAPEVFFPCEPDGSHDCPFPINDLPFEAVANTRTEGVDEFDLYNCSVADESGPEVVYVLTLDQTGDLTAEVDCDDPVVDIDVHLLDADDPDACLARDHWELTYNVTPGRYLIVADTYVEGSDVLSGAYTLRVRLD